MLVALNLRAPVASVGPVLPEVRADLGLTGISAAVLTALPVLCFGLLAVVAPRWARRAGIEAVLVVALILLAIGLGSRVWGGTNLLLIGTMVVGGSIAIANVLLPPLIKRDFAGGTGVMMGLYTTCLAGSAAIGAGLTVPLGELIGEGWRGALWIWALPAALAAAVWLPTLNNSPAPSRKQPEPGSSLARRPLAWQITVYFGLQSLIFYAMLAWLPSIYRDHGYSPAAAGFLLSLCGLVQIPVTLLLPRFAIRARNQMVHIAGSTAFMGAGLLGILIAPTAAPYLWVTLLGVGCGACFALGLALFVLRTGRVEDTARMSAMAQSIGYLICACGPLLFGLVHDVTHSWNVSLTMLLLLLVPQLVMGVLAGRARVLDTGPSPTRRQLRQAKERQLALEYRLSLDHQLALEWQQGLQLQRALDDQLARVRLPAMNAQPAEHDQQIEHRQPAEYAWPTEDFQPVLDFQPAEHVQRVEYAWPTEDFQPAQEPQSVEDGQPAQDVQPVEDSQPAQDVQPAQEPLRLPEDGRPAVERQQEPETPPAEVSVPAQRQRPLPEPAQSKRVTVHRPPRGPVPRKTWSVFARPRLRELERENQELRLRVEFLSRAVAYLSGKTSVAPAEEFDEAERTTSTSR